MTDDTDTTQDDTAQEPPDDEPTADDQPSGDGDESTAGENGSPDGRAARVADADVQSYLLKGALVMLVVLGVVATLQFYLSAQTAIRRLASDEFRPVFVAAFNLVVVLSVGVGIAQVVRRLG